VVDAAPTSIASPCGRAAAGPFLARGIELDVELGYCALSTDVP